MFSGLFKDLKVEEMVALLSCLVWQEKLQDAPKPREGLEMLFSQLQETARRVVNVQLDSKTEWKLCMHGQKGLKFYDIIMEMTPSVFEGTLIRAITRIEEVLQQLILVAKSIGEIQLEAKLEEAVTKINRDAVFATSLYV
ncbi:putative RNA helicase [Dioscorea sansibarensis]